MLTKQSMFDTAARHIIAQSEPSIGAFRDTQGVGCVYRGPNNQRCAFGPFIPDNKYVPAMEGRNAADVIQEFDIGFPRNRHDLIQFAVELQRCHDNASSLGEKGDKNRFLDHYIVAMANLAVEEGLNREALSRPAK